MKISPRALRLSLTLSGAGRDGTGHKCELVRILDLLEGAAQCVVAVHDEWLPRGRERSRIELRTDLKPCEAKSVALIFTESAGPLRKCVKQIGLEPIAVVAREDHFEFF